MGPRLIRAFVRTLLAVFYRRLDVAGLEQVPAQGPLIVAANHQNGLVDPMLLLAALPRRLRPLAKAGLFRHPIIAPFLRLARALPVHRRQDAGSDMAGNALTFRAVSEALGRGEAILIFPEGVSQPEPTLMTLRTGAARLLLEAEASGAPPVTLLPVGLVLTEPGRFRAGHALVLIGAPGRDGRLRGAARARSGRRRPHAHRPPRRRAATPDRRGRGPRDPAPDAAAGAHLAPGKRHARPILARRRGCNPPPARIAGCGRRRRRRWRISGARWRSTAASSIGWG